MGLPCVSGLQGVRWKDVGGCPLREPLQQAPALASLPWPSLPWPAWDFHASHPPAQLSVLQRLQAHMLFHVGFLKFPELTANI